jgi:hypothetical protein
VGSKGGEAQVSGMKTFVTITLCWRQTMAKGRDVRSNCILACVLYKCKLYVHPCITGAAMHCLFCSGNVLEAVPCFDHVLTVYREYFWLPAFQTSRLMVKSHE